MYHAGSPSGVRVTAFGSRRGRCARGSAPSTTEAAVAEAAAFAKLDGRFVVETDWSRLNDRALSMVAACVTHVEMASAACFLSAVDTSYARPAVHCSQLPVWKRILSS